MAAAGPGAKADGGDHMRVAVRCRPLSADERAAGEAECVTLTRDGAVEIVEGGAQSLEAGASYVPTRRFKFDYVFGSHATQSQVHSTLGREALKGFWEGFPTAVLAYGPTGSGKTHTILGPPDSAALGGEGASLGLLPRMLQDILNRLRKEARKLGHSIPNSEAGDVIVPDEALVLARGLLPPATPSADRAAALLEAWPAYGVAQVRVSYVELYAERVFDLLAPAREGAPGAAGGSTPTTPLKGRGARLRVRENKDGSTFVDGAATVAVRSWKDVEALLAKGEARRAVAATRANISSSRSHAVFTLTVVRRDVKALLASAPDIDTGPLSGRTRHPIVKCKLVVVDLAGSESARATDPLVAGAGPRGGRKW